MNDNALFSSLQGCPLQGCMERLVIGLQLRICSACLLHDTHFTSFYLLNGQILV